MADATGPSLGSLGGLPATGASGYESPVASLSPLGMLNIPQMAQVPYSNPGAAPQTPVRGTAEWGPGIAANKWYALGSISDVFQNYQDQQTERALKSQQAQFTLAENQNKLAEDQMNLQTKRIDNARTRLAQIWAAGMQNSGIRTNPQVLAQIQSAYKDLGMPVPLDPATGQPDWDALHPARTLSDLNPTQAQKFIDAIAELQPGKQREAFAKSNGIVVDPFTINDPDVKVSERMKQDAVNGWNKLLSEIANGKGSAWQVTDYLSANENALRQGWGNEKYQSIVNNPNLVGDLSAKTLAQIELLKQRGFLTEEQAKLSQANIGKAQALTDLAVTTNKLREIDVNDRPALDQARINAAQATAQKSVAMIKYYEDWLPNRLALADAGTLNAQVQSITSQLDTETRTHGDLVRSAATSYERLGAVDAGLNRAIAESEERTKTLNEDLAKLKSSTVRSSANAQTASSVTGTKVQTLHPDWVKNLINATKIGVTQDGKRYISRTTDGRYIYSDTGEPYTAPK